jgi:hypothetical protein
MGVTAGIFLASILLKEMRHLVYIRYLWKRHETTLENLVWTIELFSAKLGLTIASGET